MARGYKDRKQNQQDRPGEALVFQEVPCLYGQETTRGSARKRTEAQRVHRGHNGEKPSCSQSKTNAICAERYQRRLDRDAEQVQGYGRRSVDNYKI